MCHHRRLGLKSSESYLGRAVEIAYLYLNHSMPFVLQVFNVFKRFQSALPVTIVISSLTLA